MTFGRKNLLNVPIILFTAVWSGRRGGRRGAARGLTTAPSALRGASLYYHLLFLIYDLISLH